MILRSILLASLVLVPLLGVAAPAHAAPICVIVNEPSRTVTVPGVVTVTVHAQNHVVCIL